ncbi:MAG: hypothetical protein ACK55I_20145, partial [bacterium]
TQELTPRRAAAAGSPVVLAMRLHTPDKSSQSLGSVIPAISLSTPTVSEAVGVTERAVAQARAAAAASRVLTAG